MTTLDWPSASRTSWMGMPLSTQRDANSASARLELQKSRRTLARSRNERPSAFQAQFLQCATRGAVDRDLTAHHVVPSDFPDCQAAAAVCPPAGGEQLVSRSTSNGQEKVLAYLSDTDVRHDLSARKDV